jgi:hypothetical protein
MLHSQQGIRSKLGIKRAIVRGHATNAVFLSLPHRLILLRLFVEREPG